MCTGGEKQVTNLRNSQLQLIFREPKDRERPQSYHDMVGGNMEKDHTLTEGSCSAHPVTGHTTVQTPTQGTPDTGVMV